MSRSPGPSLEQGSPTVSFKSLAINYKSSGGTMTYVSPVSKVISVALTSSLLFPDLTAAIGIVQPSSTTGTHVIYESS